MIEYAMAAATTTALPYPPFPLEPLLNVPCFPRSHGTIVVPTVDRAISAMLPFIARANRAPERRPVTQFGPLRLLDGDRLRQIPRLVDVFAVDVRDVVGEELQRDHVDDRRQQLVDARYPQYMIRECGGFFVAVVCD